MTQPNEGPVNVPDGNSPHSFSYDYAVLDRSADDDPVWVLAHYTAVRAAELDEIGNPTAADQLGMLVWATRKLMKVVNPRPVPGGNLVFRLEDGAEMDGGG